MFNFFKNFPGGNSITESIGEPTEKDEKAQIEFNERDTKRLQRLANHADKNLLDMLDVADKIYCYKMDGYDIYATKPDKVNEENIKLDVFNNSKKNT